MRHAAVTGRNRRARAALVGVLVGLLALPALPAAVAAQGPPPDPAPPATEPADEPGATDPGPDPDATLGEEDRENLAEARAEGDDVTLLVAADDGRVDDAARQLRALGAEVEVVDDEVDYLKATLPPEDAAAAAKVSAVAAVDVDGLIERDDPVVGGAQAPTPQTAPGAGTPAVNPYLPSGDIGAPQFVAANPAYDGRGTVIAIIDSGVDLDTEALATTTTAGQPKIIEWHNANDPTSGDGMWVETGGRHTGTFTAASRTWTAPADGGPYSLGLLSETMHDLAFGELGGDLDRDGTRGETFGVLQDRANLDVYVDVDQDGDFTDEPAMQDFRGGNRDVGWLGTDLPATPVHERVAFVVGTHDSNEDPASGGPSWVSIGIAGARHGTHVAGIAAGKDLLGGSFDGVAPGAQVMAIKACLTATSCTASGVIDGVVHAAQNGADVANLSIGGLDAVNDGYDARGELFERTIADYDMQLVVSAGNSGPGANTVGEPGAGNGTIAVGASITDATWRSNYGSDSAAPLGLIPFSSRGPREDGGFKPDVVAPGSAVATIPAWQSGIPVPGTYDLPAGYGHLNGTSMAAPQVAGAVSLLISAYKATHDGARPDPAAVRDAIRGSAQPIPGVGAYEQGMGQVDVAGAWTRLQAGHAPHAISATVPSGSPLAPFLKTPGRGIGIYERDGMVAGGPARTRTYTVTRTSGPAGSLVVPVTWIGNDGTFDAPDHVALPLDTAVPIPVTISAATAGAHSAVMVLDDPATAGTDLATMNAAFVAEPFVDGVATLSGTVPRNGTRHLFVNVPAGAGSLVTTLTGGGSTPGAGQIRFLRYQPHGLPVDPTDSLSCYTPDAGSGCASSSPTSRSVTNPPGGIWEIVVDGRRTSDVADAPFTLTASIGGARVTPRRWFAGAVAVGSSAVRTHAVTNGPVAFRGRLTGGPLSSTAMRTPTIDDAGQQQYPVQVQPGSGSLTARIGSPSDPQADLDLALYNCTSGSCFLAAQSADADAEESVTISNPTPGMWIVLVLGYAVPAGTTTYDYVDSFTAPSLGSVTVADAVADRPAGATWDAVTTVTVDAAPAAGRLTTGHVHVVTDAGTTVGTGEILLAGGTDTTTTLTTGPSPSVAGQPVTLEATVTGAGSPRGRVIFYDGTAIVGAAPVSGGVARLTTTSLPVGSHTLRAVFSASGLAQDSESDTATQVVTPAPAPSLPDADAGPDQTVGFGATVTLDATGSSHPDGASLTYAWAQESGPAVALTGTDTAQPTFTAPDTAGPLTFRVVVTDPDGETDSDTVTVTVGHAPVADAGADAITNPGTTTTLDGSGSTDADGDPLTYTWTQDTGPPVSIVDASSASASFVAPASGTLTFTLTVSDGSQSDTDTVTVTVNAPPVADAGTDRVVNPGTPVTFDGTGSTDPDGDPITYAWTQTAGPAITLTAAETATPELIAPATGSVTVRLTVTDSHGLTATDDVVVAVNDAPVADAGPDQVVAAGATVTLDATGSTDPGDVLTYTWEQQSGPVVTLSSTHTATPSFVAPSVPATLLFTVTVVDPLGRADTDVVTIRVAPALAVEADVVGAANPDADVALSATVPGTTEGLTYSWTQTSGPAVTLTGADTATPTFRAPAAPATLTFEVTVTDGAGQTAADTVTVTLNQAPTAAAGPDQAVNGGAAVSLSGAGSSDPDGDDLTYAWVQTAGPSVSLTGATTADPTFTAPGGPAVLVFTLTVTDEHGLTGTDTVEVDVNAGPTADAGPDQDVDPDAAVTLDGSGSTDPDGDTITYAWTQTAGTAVTLAGATTAAPTFTAPAGPATLSFTLTVTDPGGAAATDSVTVTVNGTPAADAGADQVVNPGSTVALDGTGSTDPDGDTLTYTWTQDSGPGVELSDPGAARPTFTAPAAGELVFTLVARDPRGRSTSDQVVIRVNGVPDADAGPARTVDQGTTVTLDAGGSTDPDDDAVTYAWTQDAGPAVTLAGASTVTPTFTAPPGPASLVFIVTVTDEHGARDASAVTITVVPPLTADEEWVVEAYSTFLHRVPDASGLAYWADRLAAGTPRDIVVRSLALSPEATRGPVVTDLYERLLDRGVSASDREYWAGRLADGTPYHWVERHLLASAERYAVSGGTDAAYVTDLYQRILGRDGGEQEIAYWVGRLGSGARRLHTVDALLDTPEARAVRVAEVAEDVLGRPATEDERDDLGAAFRATRDPRTVAIAAFLLR